MDNVQERINHLKTTLTHALQELDFLETQIKFQPKAEEWITTIEAARICKIDRSTLNRYALTGRCEAKKIGGLWRFPKARVQDMSFIKDVS